MHTKTKGDISEAMIIANLLQRGFVVLKPLGDNQRYDVVIDWNGKFYRIQCKTGKLVKDIIRFNVSSSYSYKGSHHTKHYRGDADFFGVYCPDNNGCYLIPVSEVGIKIAYLRIGAPKNGQEKNIRLASDFLIPHSSAGLEQPTSNRQVAGSSPAAVALSLGL